MEDILARLRANESQEGTPTPPGSNTRKPKAANAILSTLNDQLKQQKMDLGVENTPAGPKELDSSFESDAITPASDFDIVSAGTDISHRSSEEEMTRIKQELADMKARIQRQDVELAESRNLKFTIDEATGPASEADFNPQDTSEQDTGKFRRAFDVSAHPFTARQDNWVGQDDQSSAFPTNGYSRSNRPWSNNQPPQSFLNDNFGSHLNQQVPYHDSRDNFSTDQSWNRPAGGTGFISQGQISPTHRLFSGPSTAPLGMDGRFVPDQSQFIQSGGNRRAASGFNRPGSGLTNRTNPFGNIGANPTPIQTSSSMAPLGYASAFGYQPRPIGSSLSPTASEFSSGSSMGGVASFSAGPLSGSGIPATSVPSASLPSFGSPWTSVSSFVQLRTYLIEVLH